MSTSPPIDKQLEKRQEILDELWALVGDLAHPGSVQVAALDKIAKIEGAYTPIKIQKVNKFTNLADFYAKTTRPPVDVAADVVSEATAGIVPEVKIDLPFVGTEQNEVDEDDDEEFGFL